PGTLAAFNTPAGVAVDGDGNVFVADRTNDRIRKITPAGIVSTFAGSGTFGSLDGPATTAQFSLPAGVAVDADGNVYVADNLSNRIRKITPGGVVSTLAGSGTFGSADGVGTAAEFGSPAGVAVDIVGNVYVADVNNNTIRKITPGGVVSTLAGSGSIGAADGVGQAAQFYNPAGVAVDATGNIYVSDSSNNAIRKVIGDPLPGQATLAIGSVLGVAGSESKIDLTVDANVPVGGVQFRVVLGDTVKATFVGLADTTLNPGFTFSTTTVGDTVKVVVVSFAGDLLPPGETLLGRLCIRLNNPALGDSIMMTLLAPQVVDSVGTIMVVNTVDGVIDVGLRGDITRDGEVSVSDIVVLVRQLIGKDPLPAFGTSGFVLGDMNQDGSMDVSDAVAMVNNILGLTKPLANGPIQPVVVDLGEIQMLEDGQMVLPVSLDADGVVTALHASFTFDPTRLEIGTPQMANSASGLVFDSYVSGGTLNLVAYAAMPGQHIPPGQNTILLIPVTVLDGANENPAVTLTDMTLVNSQALSIPVTLGVTSMTVVVGKTEVPGTFALGYASPNPFNPSTTISYEVPQQAHIRIVVYNVLGQEVTRLVDTVQTPGRYQAIWNARNGQGRAVSSGIYMYRLTSSTGFNDTRRMTLLK
ncbi:MAG: T9SS type A sorting domain-containing protein, partial [Candidatus Latescibacteria bacterium]|nr:T9SS type A sorting domain-containing protein [Candidatus Latescibacterota bacterium]